MGVAAQAGEAFFLGALGLGVLGGLVGIEQGLYGGDFPGDGEAGEVVLGGAGDEGSGALDEGGAVRVDAGDRMSPGRIRLR